MRDNIVSLLARVPGTEFVEISPDRIRVIIVRGTLQATVTVALSTVKVDTQIFAKAPIEGLGAFKAEMDALEATLSGV